MVALDTLIPLKINKEVLDQIKYLCKSIPKEEWSGVLFYTTKGSITKPNKFSIEIKTILPLDKGTSVFTSYDLDERFINFLEEDFEERSTWKVGHIHSHNVMKVFFSGTDIEELLDNAPKHNMYLSLIVNNYMEFVAKVAILAQTVSPVINQVPYMALDENGKEYPILKQDFNITSTRIFTYDCQISSPNTSIQVSEEFANQVEDILKPKVEITPFKEFNKENQGKNPWESFTKGKEEEEAEEEDTQHWLFIFELFKEPSLKLKSQYSTSWSVEELMEEIKNTKIKGENLAKIVLKRFIPTFKTFFPNVQNRFLILKSYEIINILEEESLYYPILNETVILLSDLLEKLVENENKSTSK